MVESSVSASEPLAINQDVVGVAPKPGQHWAHFLIRNEIARGNMGVVYRALDTRSEREVALKILVVGHRDPEAGERFKREAKSLARLSHQHIVNVHSYGVHQGIPFLTMDYVPGTNLQELLDRGALTRARSVDMLAKICHALDHAHTRGVLHRDVKPANVLIGPDGAPKVTDFGLARLQDASVSLTHDGDLIGTPVYMSPEQIQGEHRKMGPTSDVWALGVILYAMLTRALPFRGKTVDVVSQAVVQMDPEPPTAVDPETPIDLERICLTALQKEPRLRYQSAGELARDLDAYLSGRPVLAGTVTIAVRARRAARFARLHAGVLAAIGACLLLALVVLGINRVMSGAALERTAQEFVTRAAKRRHSAWQALSLSERALRGLDPWQAHKHASQAEQELSWAAAFLDRSQAPRSGPVDPKVFEAPPSADEVTRGLDSDPLLRQLRAAARGLRGRALVAGATGSVRPPPPGERGAGAPASPTETVAPESLLIPAFQAGGRLVDLEALVRLATRRGSLELVQEALALLQAQLPPDRGVSPPRAARLLRLRAAIAAATPGQDPRGLWAPHRGQPGPVGDVALELELDWLLERDRGLEADQLLRGAPLGVEVPLQRARALRVQRRWAEHRALLRPLVGGKRPQLSLELRSRCELAEGGLDRGMPRLVRAGMRGLLSDRLPPNEEARTSMLEAVAASLLDGRGTERLAAIVKDPRVDLDLRYRAAEIAKLLAPSVKLETLPFGPAPLRSRLYVAQAARHVEAALEVIALRALGLRASALTEPDYLARALTMGEIGRELGDPRALAASAIVLMGAGRVDQAAPVLRAVPDYAHGHPGVLLADRLLDKERAFRTGAPTKFLIHRLPPWGLVEGRAALAVYQHEVNEGKGADSTAQRARREASHALDIAVRVDPFHVAPRLARARLSLLAAGHDAGDPTRLRRRAVNDAASACALAPDAVEAWSLLFQAVWVTRRADLLKLSSAIKERAEELDAADGRLLKALLERAQGRPPAWRMSPATSAVGQRAVRAYRQLSRAAGLPVETLAVINVAAQLRMELSANEKAGNRFRVALLWGDLILEDPSELDGFLLGTSKLRLTARDRDELDTMVARRHPRAITARVVRLLDSLLGLRDAPSPEARQATLAGGRKDVEAIARSRPVPAVLALRALLEVWAGRPDSAELLDLAARPWRGKLHVLLRDLAEGRKPVGRDLKKLHELKPLARLSAQ